LSYFIIFPPSTGAYTPLGTGDSTDIDAFSDTAAQPEEEFADFSSAFAQTNSNSSSSSHSGLPVSVPATAATPDLFGDFGAATNMPSAVGAANGGEVDLFGLLPSPVAAPPHFPSAGPAAVSSLDLLGGLDLVGGGPVPSFAAANMSAPSSLPPLQPATLLPAGKDIYGYRYYTTEVKYKETGYCVLFS
jgi:hypothetical protein